MSTLESKFRSVENLDRAVQHLMRKLEAVERVSEANYVATSIRFEEEAEKAANRFNVINQKLDKLSAQFDSVCEEEEKDLLEELIALPSIRRSRILAPPPNVNGLKGTPASNVDAAVEDMRETVEGMDRRLAFHINIVAENLGKMSDMVEDVHEAVFEDVVAYGRRRSNSTRKKVSKLDGIKASLKPLRGLEAKMETVKKGVFEAKSTVNDLIPASKELMGQNRRQQRALSIMQRTFKDKTDVIFSEISKLNRELEGTRETLALVASSAATTTSSIGDLATSASSATASFLNDVDSNSNDTKGPSVIFPSVENKPVVIVNGSSTFAYQRGFNVDGVQGKSCAELYEKGLEDDGVYYLRIEGTRFWHLKAYCESGWTVIQRRGIQDEEKPENFNRGWDDYKLGFGDVSKEFWLGNENVFMLTHAVDHELRIELEDFEGNTRYAEYKSFRLGSEKELYRLEIGGYQGTAGDALNDPWYGSNLRPFSTFDQDNDRSSLNCASMLKGGWWWKSCGRGLNGLYLKNPDDLAARQGIVWFRWKGWDYALKASKMMIRPKQ